MGIRSGAARRLFPLLVGPILGLLLIVGSVAPTAPVARALTLPSYRIDASLDVDGGRLAGRQIVRFRNAVGRPLDSVVFHVMPAALGAFSLESSAVDGRAHDARLNGSVLEIPFVAPLAAGATAEIDLRYTVRLPRVAGRISATGQAITLGRWFPILSVHHGDWDRRQYVDVGDAFFTAVADYDVTLTTSRPLVVAATGQAVERDGTRWRFVASGIRDFALTASPDYAVRSVAAGDGGATVSGYARSAQTAQLFARVGATFVRWYGDRFGPYPYPSLAIAEASIPASFGGLEYPALIMLPPQGDLSSTAAGGALEILIAHEVAH